MSVCISSYRAAVELDPMDVSEVDDVLFIFSAYPGETIDAVGVTASRVRGPADADAQAMASGPPVVGRMEADNVFVTDPTGLVVLQRFDAQGRTERATYCWRCVAKLTSGRVLTIAAHVQVRKL